MPLHKICVCLCVEHDGHAAATLFNTRIKGAIGDCLQKHLLLCWLNVSSHPDSNH